MAGHRKLFLPTGQPGRAPPAQASSSGRLPTTYPPGVANSRSSISFPIRKSSSMLDVSVVSVGPDSEPMPCTEIKGKVVAGSDPDLMPSSVLGSGGEKRKRSYEDDDDNGSLAAALGKRRISNFGNTGAASRPTEGNSTLIPSKHYVRSRNIVNKHTIDLGTWDEQIRENKLFQVEPSDVFWTHRPYVAISFKVRKERCFLVNLIADITAMKHYSYFLCVPCVRRPEHLPREARDASSELLKTIRICLLRKIKDSALRERYERDAEKKAEDDVKGIYAAPMTTATCSGALRGSSIGGLQVQPSLRESSTIKERDVLKKYKELPDVSPTVTKTRQPSSNLSPSPTTRSHPASSPFSMIKTTPYKGSMLLTSPTSTRHTSSPLDSVLPSPTSFRNEKQTLSSTPETSDSTVAKRKTATEIEDQFDLDIIAVRRATLQAVRVDAQAKTKDMELLEEELKIRKKIDLRKEEQAQTLGRE